MKLNALFCNLKGPVLYRESTTRDLLRISTGFQFVLHFSEGIFSHWLPMRRFFFLQTLYLTVFDMFVDDDRQNMTLL